MNMPTCQVIGLFTGKTKALLDERGEYQSSIARDLQEGPVVLEKRGFVGDKATQPYHGSLDQAVCIHSQTHYDFWNKTLDMTLQPGAVGENLTLDRWDDETLCIGDILRIGTATLQISAPRMPCETQARHVGRTDWVKQTLKALRTGIYARVLAGGVVQVGDQVVLEQRLNPGLTVFIYNKCFYHDFDANVAKRFIDADGLMAFGKQILQEKLDKANQD